VIARSARNGPTQAGPSYDSCRTVPYLTSDPLVTGVGATTVSYTPTETTDRRGALVLVAV
jgi:hypothetical protein